MFEGVLSLYEFKVVFDYCRRIFVHEQYTSPR